MHTDINETSIRQFVSDFYAAVRRDPEIGPVFARQVDDWAEHEDRLTDFWSSVLLASGRYKGNPLRAHLGVPDLEGKHFSAWLDLFEEVAERDFSPESARQIVARAHRMAEHLQSHLAVA